MLEVARLLRVEVGGGIVVVVMIVIVGVVVDVLLV